MTPSKPQATSGQAVRVVAWPCHHGLRLDQALAAATGLPRRRAREMVSSGRVLRNGEAVRVQSRTVEAGDVLELYLDGSAEPPPQPPEPPPVTVLYDDRQLLVADKPAGVLSQPASSATADELAMDQRLLLNLALAEGTPPFLRLVHRLDRLTTGVLLFARHPASLGPLAAAWREGRVERVYLAVVEGHPAGDTLQLDDPIGRDHDHAWRFRVDPRGRPAQTAITVVGRTIVAGRQLALVECRLGSGRTHQVRVHLAAAGHPVVGDRLYGSRCPAERPLLHASTIALPHPATGEPLRVVAPMPADLASWWG
jgi:23S rRNA pseudouridine1911/1915/1917 synthase